MMTKLISRGVTVCRIRNDDYIMLMQELQKDATKRNLIDFFYSFFQAPYEGYSGTENIQDSYYDHIWSCRGEECLGLALAFLADTVSLSFDSKTWTEVITIKSDSTERTVRNISKGDHVDFYESWFDSLRNIELKETELGIDDKLIKLRDDHGKDTLLNFAKKLCTSSYVEGVVNSLPFNNQEKKFIRRVRDNGIIECVLCWTDAGYGLVVQTTGRNLRETSIIAEKLKNDFAK